MCLCICGCRLHVFIFSLGWCRWAGSLGKQRVPIRFGWRTEEYREIVGKIKNVERSSRNQRERGGTTGREGQFFISFARSPPTHFTVTHTMGRWDLQTGARVDDCVALNRPHAYHAMEMRLSEKREVRRGVGVTYRHARYPRLGGGTRPIYPFGSRASGLLAGCAAPAKFKRGLICMVYVCSDTSTTGKQDTTL